MTNQADSIRPAPLSSSGLVPAGVPQAPAVSLTDVDRQVWLQVLKRLADPRRPGGCGITAFGFARTAQADRRDYGIMLRLGLTGAWCPANPRAVAHSVLSASMMIRGDAGRAFEYVGL